MSVSRYPLKGLPTADDVARAMVTAAKHTEENPIDYAEQKMGVGTRGRHYALHALLLVFPDLDRFAACRIVGCPGKPSAFWNTSWHQIVKPRGSGMGPTASWWDAAVLDDVATQIVACRRIVPQFGRGFRTCEAIERRPATVVGATVSREITGDPAPGRSALDQRRAQDDKAPR